MLACISYFRNLYIKMSFLKNKNYPAMPQQLNSDSSELRGADKLNFSALMQVMEIIQVWYADAVSYSG